MKVLESRTGNDIFMCRNLWKSLALKSSYGEGKNLCHLLWDTQACVWCCKTLFYRNWSFAIIYFLVLRWTFVNLFSSLLWSTAGPCKKIGCGWGVVMFLCVESLVTQQGCWFTELQNMIIVFSPWGEPEHWEAAVATAARKEALPKFLWGWSTWLLSKSDQI